jgi:hypothetical protein
MKSIFKNIRFNLVEKNKKARYLKYAIGEIALILIGILLALSISDWNDKRIEKQKERTTLTELRQSILLDLELLSEGLQTVTKSVSDLEYLQTIITDENYPYNKDLDTLFGVVWGMRILKPNSAFYEDLKSSGLNLIKDDSIRFQIVQLFETNYGWLNWINELEMSINDVNRPYYLENFHQLVFSKYATPNNFDHVWTDPYYHNIIDYRRITLDNQVKNYGNSAIAIRQLAEAIDSYLNK